MTPVEKKLIEQQQILDGVRTWSGRLKKLAERKKDPKRVKTFCMDHEIPYSDFSRFINEKRAPKKTTYDKIEKAFTDEGV